MILSVAPNSFIIESMKPMVSLVELEVSYKHKENPSAVAFAVALLLGGPFNRLVNIKHFYSLLNQDFVSCGENQND